jgi:TonB family protein
MLRCLAVGLMATASLAAALPAEERALVAGRDVPAPRRVAWVQPERPHAARQAGVVGLVLLEVTLDETGKPVDIKVVRGEPILDKAAIDAAIASRYDPTVVDGVARRVVLTLPVEFFGDLGQALKYYGDLAADKRESVRIRLFAISRLKKAPPAGREDAKRALQKLSSASEPEVASAAAGALQEMR